MNSSGSTLVVPYKNNQLLFDEFSDFFGETNNRKQNNVNSEKKIMGREFTLDSSFKSPLNSKTNKVGNKFFEKTTSKSTFTSMISSNDNSSLAQGNKRKCNWDDFEDHNSYFPSPTSFNVINKTPVPPTPIKKQRLCSVAQKAIDVASKFEHTVHTDNGEITFNINPEPFGRGTFSNVHEILSGQPKLFESYNNDELVFKCFKKSTVEKENSFIEGYFKNIVNQYKELKKLGFPVAEILNIETVESDRFILMNKIPTPFKINIGMTTRIEELDERTKNYLDQVKAGFAFAYNNDMCLDYKKSNVGIKYEGAVNPYGDIILFDFMENKDNLKCYIDLAVQSFAKNDQGIGNQEIYDYLMPKEVPLQYRSQLVDEMCFKQNEVFSKDINHDSWVGFFDPKGL